MHTGDNCVNRSPALGHKPDTTPPFALCPSLRPNMSHSVPSPHTPYTQLVNPLNKLNCAGSVSWPSWHCPLLSARNPSQLLDPLFSESIGNSVWSVQVPGVAPLPSAPHCPVCPLSTPGCSHLHHHLRKFLQNSVPRPP